jgi:spoIIIJ-associated protein
MSEPIWTAEEIQQKLADFLQPVLRAAGLQLEFDVRPASADNDLISPDYIVDFRGRDVELLLQQRAELLLSLEQLTLEALRVSSDNRYRLVFDAEDYRLMRIEELRLAAETAAEKVKQTDMPFRFSPMTSRERRILHLALRNDSAVETVSEGVVPNRHTVIYPASKKPAAAKPPR